MTDFAYVSAPTVGDQDNEVPRPVTRDNVSLALSAAEWLDDLIDGVITDYRRIFEIKARGGVVDFSILDTLSITTEDSYGNRNDYDLPLTYLYATPVERQQAMVKDFAKQNKVTVAQQRKDDLSRAADLEREAARLRARAAG